MGCIFTCAMLYSSGNMFSGLCYMVCLSYIEQVLEVVYVAAAGKVTLEHHLPLTRRLLLLCTLRGRMSCCSLVLGKCCKVAAE